ncbi:efflux RND transporter periplasmic adaptor subunit [Marinobacter sp. 71-i]|uniref:Efflux RND transporter periplasmic adaptor subunit n=1 Tax=Marinobacter iranensis TaxID=2962607 RepID=A0ABT5YFJ2_9GAMM|nr:efflux RND transporter periplasmic adaptor subunit [Marinobacter iranensis]MDF0752428.1 efflux RND transporter periplasmic adaptor subunit [Marinobacter iranensis]
MSQPIDENAVRPERGKAGPLKTVFVSLMIVLVGVALIWLIFKTEPSATRSDTARETAMLVDVQSVTRGRFTPTVEVMGQVVPAREITLGSQVSGEIIYQADAFTPGRHVEKGGELLRIEPADYQATLQQRRSELQQARAELEIEQGQQAVARQEFELLGEDIKTANQALILRKPQLEQARARVSAAAAAVQQAELALARTRIRAPFPAQVLSREVALGSQVSVGQSLGRLVGIGQYWVEATVPLSKLRWLTFKEAPGSPAAPVTLFHDTVWPAGQTREGQLTQLVGELDTNARMARVLITVEDPLALEEAAGAPPLILGTFVRAEIAGRALVDVVRLERNLLRRSNTVWVMEDRKLAIRDVEIAFQNEEYAFIRTGLDSGDKVITTDLASVVSGARLRLEGDQEEGESERGDRNE